MLIQIIKTETVYKMYMMRYINLNRLNYTIFIRLKEKNYTINEKFLK